MKATRWWAKHHNEPWTAPESPPTSQPDQRLRGLGSWTHHTG